VNRVTLCFVPAVLALATITMIVWLTFESLRCSSRLILQNLFLAFAHSTLLIPVATEVFYSACGLLLSPVLAAEVMALSGVFVLGNAFRLR
jgi:cation transport ATPase